MTRSDQREPVTRFRRRRGMVSPRRKSPWRQLLRPLVDASLLVGLPLLLAGWAWSSPRFVLRETSIRTGERVPEPWVERAVDPFLGERLLALDLEAVEAEVSEHPWVAGVESRKELPDRLVLSVRERKPAAVRADDPPTLLDEDGFPIVPCDDPSAADLSCDAFVSIRGGGARPEVAGAVRLVRELGTFSTPLHEGLRAVEVLGGGDYRLRTDSLPFSVSVSADGLEAAVTALESRLVQVRRLATGADDVDLRFHGQIVIQSVT